MGLRGERVVGEDVRLVLIYVLAGVRAYKDKVRELVRDGEADVFPVLAVVVENGGPGGVEAGRVDGDGVGPVKLNLDTQPLRWLRVANGADAHAAYELPDRKGIDVDAPNPR